MVIHVKNILLQIDHSLCLVLSPSARRLVKNMSCKLKNIFLQSSTKTYLVGTQKSGLNSSSFEHQNYMC